MALIYSTFLDDVQRNAVPDFSIAQIFSGKFGAQNTKYRTNPKCRVPNVQETEIFETYAYYQPITSDFREKT
jgi:hypothetical protein